MTELTKKHLAISVADVLPIVDAVVAQMGRHLPAHVSMEDLASAGKLALVEILGSFSGSADEARSYVVSCVRGAVLDEMRRQDPLSRYGRDQVKLVRRTVAKLEVRHGRTPTDVEIAAEAGLTVSAVHKVEQLAIAADAMSLDALDADGRPVSAVADANATSPAVSAENSETMDAIQIALSRLSPTLAHVLRRYYFDDATLQEIASELGVSVVRVHQLRSTGENKLRDDVNVLATWTGMLPGSHCE